MKLAAQENMITGDDLPDKLQKMESYGFEGIEFWGRGLADRVGEVKDALASSNVKPATICAGYGGCLLDPGKSERDKAMSDIKQLLTVGADLGVVGLITVPIFGKPRVPDLSPYAEAIDIEKKLLTLQVQELGNHAQDVGCILLLEPLNRYETHFLKKLDDAVEIQKAAGSEGVKIMADFFHMSIEEENIAQSIEEAGDAIYHIHLADSTRKLPGYGHTDFKAGFAALKDIGFDKYMALECGIPGDPEVELPKAVRYLKSCM
jgi:sugar phosphate isomerase/epimerase